MFYGIQKILYEVRDGVAVITINSPKTLNAINDEIIEELLPGHHRREGRRRGVGDGPHRRGQGILCRGELGSFREGLENGTLDMAANMRNSSRLPVAIKTPESRSLPPCGAPPPERVQPGAVLRLLLCRRQRQIHRSICGCGAAARHRRALRPGPRRWATPGPSRCA